MLLNMESFPQFNEIPLSAEQVIEALKNNPENIEALTKFIDAREKTCKDGVDTLNLQIEIARIQAAAGFIDAARDSFEAAAYSAQQEGNDALHEELLNELDRLG